MFTLGIPNRQYRRTTQVLGHEGAKPIEYEAKKQDDGFYIFEFPNVDEFDFKDIVLLLKSNGVTTIGADEQLSEKKIMKLTDLIKEDFQSEQLTRMETAEDIIVVLEKVLDIWETKEYKSDQAKWMEYSYDIEKIVEDFRENQSIDRPDTDIQEQKLRKIIKDEYKRFTKTV